MKKYPHTKQGMAKRRNHAIASATRNPQFNPSNGEVHTKKFLAEQRNAGLRRRRKAVVIK